jgi:hypothetical protein
MRPDALYFVLLLYLMPDDFTCQGEGAAINPLSASALPLQGVSYSQKFRVKRGFPNYLEVAISQFGSAKK